jgi:hypothetical protein
LFPTAIIWRSPDLRATIGRPSRAVPPRDPNDGEDEEDEEDGGDEDTTARRPSFENQMKISHAELAALLDPARSMRVGA